jgi:hypothetical protein
MLLFCSILINPPDAVAQMDRATACKLATKAPSGAQWADEIKLGGYRMAARIEGGRVKLRTGSGLDWTAKYPATAAGFAKLKMTAAYVDGELGGVRPDRRHLVRTDAAGREAHLFRLRPPRTRRRGHRPPAPGRAQKAVGRSLATNSAGIRARRRPRQ